MERFSIYQKKASGNIGTQINIAVLIPQGRDNTIDRFELTRKCIDAGLIRDCGNDESNDRSMRKLLRIARRDYVILNRSGGGYYRPTKDELKELQKYIRQEESRAKAVFANLKMAKALYEDLKAGRLDGDA